MICLTWQPASSLIFNVLSTATISWILKENNEKTWAGADAVKVFTVKEKPLTILCNMFFCICPSVWTFIKLCLTCELKGQTFFIFIPPPGVQG